MDAIVVKNVTKTFRGGVGRARVREMLPPPVDRFVARALPRWWARDSFNALEDVSFSLPAGSATGVIGQNAAGKTTLLKVLAGVTAPTSGTVTLTGRVAALIDVVVGFHPDLTGRENVYLLAGMSGFTRRAMRRRIEDVFAFADIEGLVDMPLKRYSAGMAARLAFATMTAIDADLLLVDEVLAVGDASFQRKCVLWLNDYRRRGGTLMFVTHNLSLLRNMTERVLWIDHGKLIEEGSTTDIMPRYARAMERRDGAGHAHNPYAARRMLASRGLDRWGAGGALVEEVQFNEPPTGGSWLDVDIRFEVSALERATFCVGFIDEGGREIGAAISPDVSLNGGKGVVRCSLRPLQLRSGIYFPVIAILDAEGRIRDRWRLDRAVVVERNGETALAEAFGPVDLTAVWGMREVV